LLVVGALDLLQAEPGVDRVLGAGPRALDERGRLRALPAGLLADGAGRRRGDGPAALVGLERRVGQLGTVGDELGVVDPLAKALGRRVRRDRDRDLDLLVQVLGRDVELPQLPAARVAGRGPPLAGAAGRAAGGAV